MTIQTVPYALQNASHSAALFRQAEAAIWQTGGVVVAGELAVGAQSTPNMSVQVGAGRAVVAGTQVSAPTLLGGGAAAFTTQGMYFCLNDGPVTLTIAASDPTNPRIDVPYLAVQDSFYSGANNQAVLAVATGTPAPSPVAPSIPSNAISLGAIAVAANATSIVSANLTSGAVLAQPVTPPRLAQQIVSPTSASAGTGSVVVSALGKIVFTNASTLIVNGCFTAAFDNYVLALDITSQSASTPVNLQLAAAGTPNGAQYYDEIIYANVSAVSGVQQNNQGYFTIHAGGGLAHKSKVELTGPFLAAATMFNSESSDMANLTGGAVIHTRVGGYHVPTSSFDGLALTPASGTMTGVLRVYGWNNG